jgi:hypothetical protein
MSLLSAIILPKLEKELVSLKPEIASFALHQLKYIAEEIIAWAEKKADIDGLMHAHKDDKNV